ncbi:Fc.00g113630.m01.CDS01 [Cosmosporella sp. VM-42]
MSLPSTQPFIPNTTEFVSESPHQSQKSVGMRKSQPPNVRVVSTRKRSKTSDNVEEEEEEEEEEEKKRSRGRPRLDTKDETAADRRRTQIRLAQRAYRHRKDTAITTLEQKVKDLEQANENMGKEFMNFYDFVLTQGTLESAPEVARRLNDTTRKFLSLARKSADDPSKDDIPDASVAGEASQTAVTQQKDLKQSSSPSSSHSATSNSQVQTSTSGEASFVSASRTSSYRAFNTTSHLPYEVITQPTPENASFPMYDTQGELPFFENPYSTSSYSSLPAPFSYAFQERSFGRRLQRATLEAGLRLVSLANPPPHRYAAVFGFCLLFESRESIIQRLKVSLNRTRQESMYMWKFPFTNLGGAGFSLNNADGSGGMLTEGSTGGEFPIGNQGVREFYKPSEMTGFSMGPFGPEVESTRDDRVDHKMRMLFQGFEGDFYDSDEVDTYLRQRGVIIPENADFIESEIDITAFQEAPELRSGTGEPSDLRFFWGTSVPTSDLELPGLTTNNMDALGNMWSTAPPTTMASSTMLNASLTTAPRGPQLGSLVPDVPVSGPPAAFISGPMSYGAHTAFPQTWAADSPSAWMKTRVMINVDQLITEMVGRAVCLGRTPGLRQKDVDTAVRIAAGLQQRS